MKKQIKKTISLLLVLALLCPVMPASAADEVAYAVEGGNIYFDPSTGEITDCDETVTSVVIPERIDGVSVTSIGEGVFVGCHSLTSINIPDSVISIGNDAFGTCVNLTEVIIPEGVTRINDRLFAYCTSLTNLVIPESVTSIGYGVFWDCESLTEIAIPDSVTSIGDSAFVNCTGLTEITIPDSVTNIGGDVFRNCTSLSEMTIPSSVTSLGEGMFWGCTGLERIVVDGTNDHYLSIDGILFNKDISKLICFPPKKQETEYAIPDSVNEISNDAFSYCSNLNIVTIPNSVNSIGGRAFLGCENLSEIILPDGIANIEHRSFSGCTNLISITIPNGVISIGERAFNGCTSLADVFFIGSEEQWQLISISEYNEPLINAAIHYAYTEEDSVITYAVEGGNIYFNMTTGEITDCDSGVISADIPASINGVSVASVGNSAFLDCPSLTSIVTPDSVTSIEVGAFLNCTSLISIVIPDSVTNIEVGAFLNCISLTDVYYTGDEAQWQGITIGESNDPLTTATIHYNYVPEEHIYNTTDPGESVVLPTDELESVTDSASAAEAVTVLTDSMTEEQKASPTGADLATLYAETAVSEAATKAVSGNEVIINAAAVADLEEQARQTSEAVETALVNGGVATARYISNIITLKTESTGKITIKIDPDILTTEVDKIRVETPTYAITLKMSDLAVDLTEILTITTEDVGAGFALTGGSGMTVVSVDLPGGRTTNSVTVSLPTDAEDATYMTVANTEGAATSSKFNPATVEMDGRINVSGSYTVITNEKDFSDIADKSIEMQKAIRYLASKGIISGTTETTFSPDAGISRAEIASLLVRALGKLDRTATTTFVDVTTSDWFYASAASSQKHGLIAGYEDDTFRGLTQISKEQILAVASRVLRTEMGYSNPSDPWAYLSRYSDGVTEWAQPGVALATRENLVVYRTDGRFAGTQGMTRGDAAIVVYRLFNKIW